MVNDIDNANLSSATVSITAGFASGEDTLAVVNQNGISATYNAGTGVLSLSGSATVAQYQAALRSITYFNSSNNPSTATRTISFVVNDGALASNTATRNISISAINDAPVVGTSASVLLYNENDPATPIDPGLTVVDVDNINLTSATIRIDAGFVASEDGLVFNDQNGISGSYNVATGVLSLSGSASVADYQTALRSVAYVNGADNPNASSRTVSFVVNDGSLYGAPATRTVNIHTVSDAPVLVVSGGTLAYAENQAATAVDEALAASDVDSSNLLGATVSISAGFVAAEDALVFTNQFGISGSYNAATGVLSLSGPASVAQYQTALRSVSYVNTSDNPNTVNRSVTFVVTDGVLASNMGSRDISLTASNDAPVLSTSASSLVVPENAVATVVDANLIASDADSALLGGASVQIGTGFVASQDSLGFVDQNGISGSYDAASGTLKLTGSASLAQYQVALRSVTYSNNSDNPNTAPRTVGFVLHDGAASSAVAYRFLDLNPANDAPGLVGSGGSLVYTENDAATPVDAALALHDVDNTGLTSATVSLTAGYASGQDRLVFVDQNGISGSWNAAAGVLTLSGSASVADYQSALRAVAYVNSSDKPSQAVRSVVFQVDDGQAVNGKSNTVTRDIRVVAVNDAPTASNLNTSQSYTEGLPLALAAIVVSDPDIDVDSVGSASDITAVLTLSNPRAGSLNSATFGTASASFDAASGVWRATGALADVNRLLAGLVFTPRTGPGSELGTDGDFNADFSIATSITDVAGAAVSGNKLMLGTPVNDEQVLALNAGLSVLENSSGSVIGAAVLRADDVDNRAEELVYTVTRSPEHGSLRLDGVLLSAKAHFSQADINSGRLRYDHDGSETAADGFGFDVDDGAGTLTRGQFNITVRPVNDHAPVITSHGGGASADVQVAENSTAVGLVQASDIDQPGASLRYSIGGGADAALFSIDAQSGVLRFVNAPDFEAPLDADADNVYALTVVADDGQFSDSQDLRVQVQPRNDTSPRFTTPASWLVDENTQAVAQLHAVDADLPATTLRYSIVGGVDAARFAIDENTGALVFLAAANFEAATDDGADNSYQLIVQAHDGELSGQQALTVRVRDVNEAPQLAEQSARVAEGDTLRVNLAAGATDPDAGANGQLNLASAVLVQGPTHGSVTFSADGTALYRHDGSEPHGAAVSDSFSYTLRDAGGLVSNVALVHLGVTPVNDAPTLTLRPVTLTGGGSLVLSPGLWLATDADNSPDSLVWLVSDMRQGRFESVAAPGLAVLHFTQADVAAGAVRLVSFSGSQPPTFSVVAFDGQAYSATATGAVDFIHNPLAPVLAAEPTPPPAPSTTPAAAAPPKPDAAAPTGPAPAALPAADAAASLAATSLTVALALREQPLRSGQNTADDGNAARPVSAAVATDFSTTITRNAANAGALLGYAGLQGGPAWNGIDLGILVSSDNPLSSNPLLRTLDTAAPTRTSLQATPVYNDSSARRASSEQGLIDLSAAEVGQMTGLALTAGTVWWALHTGGALTGLLFSLPAWRHADLLAVLPDEDGDEDGDGEDTERGDESDESDESDDWAAPEDAETARDERAAGRLFDASPEGETR